jgi:hypothetical protein
MLAQIGTTEDRDVIREQLQQLQSRAAVRELTGDAMSEIDMIEALNHGRNWDSTQAERVAVERSCVTLGCKQHFVKDVPSQ